MNAEVERLSAELRDELASNERRIVDPRFVPVRFSSLKHMARSPLHYRHAVQHHREETLSMRLGTGVHALVFGTPTVVVFKARRAGKVWEAFEAANEGNVILNEREHAIASAMARALTTDFVADPLLFAPGTKHEHEVRWQLWGRDCGGRLDALGPAAVSDLKSTKDGDPRWFPYQVRREHWHVQATWYADGCEAAGLGWRHPHLVTVESAAPHAVTVWRLRDKEIRQARDTYREWFERVLDCEQTNTWPGYSDDVLELALPGADRESESGDADGGEERDWQ